MGTMYLLCPFAHILVEFPAKHFTDEETCSEGTHLPQSHSWKGEAQDETKPAPESILQTPQGTWTESPFCGTDFLFPMALGGEEHLSLLL